MLQSKKTTIQCIARLCPQLSNEISKRQHQHLLINMHASFDSKSQTYRGLAMHYCAQTFRLHRFSQTILPSQYRMVLPRTSLCAILNNILSMAIGDICSKLDLTLLSEV